MRKTLFYGFLVVMLGVFCLSSLVYAETEEATTTDDSTTQEEVTTVDSTAVEENSGETDEVAAEEELEDMKVEEITKVPSGLGLWWRGVKERISIGLTSDPVKKAEKQLKYAEERMRIADIIAEKATDPKVQEKAQKMVERAQNLMEKVEDKREKWMENKDERSVKLLKNIATHHIRREHVMDRLEEKLEGKLSEEQMERLQEVREQGLEGGKRLLNAINNENVPENVREHLQNVKDRVDEHAEEVKLFRDKKHDLLQKAAAGDEEAKEALKELNQERKEELHERTEAFKEKLHNLKDAVKEGSEAALKKLRAMDRAEDVRDKAEDIRDRREDRFDASGKDVEVCVKGCLEEGGEQTTCEARCKKADIVEDRRDEREDMRDEKEDLRDAANGVAPKSGVIQRIKNKVFSPGGFGNKPADNVEVKPNTAEVQPRAEAKPDEIFSPGGWD